MKVAVVGSRDFKLSGAPDATDVFVEHIIKTLLREYGKLTVLSGGARGVDTLVREACVNLGFHVCTGNFDDEMQNAGRNHFVEYLAMWRDEEGKVDRGAGFRRNRRVVAEADIVIALFADGPSTPGTKHVVAEARKAGLPVSVWHEGEWLAYPGAYS